jgi:hypothetical protein
MLENVTKETFEPLKGQRFTLTDGANPALDLELVGVGGNGLRGAASREQFSLHFRGPLTPQLPQRIYRLAHDQLGVMDIFLVPIARDAGGMTYEAIFS